MLHRYAGGALAVDPGVSLLKPNLEPPRLYVRRSWQHRSTMVVSLILLSWGNPRDCAARHALLSTYP